VSVLVSVYIIRVHCPLHHWPRYILRSCENLKLREVKYKLPKSLHSKYCMNCKMQENKG